MLGLNKFPGYVAIDADLKRFAGLFLEKLILLNTARTSIQHSGIQSVAACLTHCE